jgi:hypothetical protein
VSSLETRFRNEGEMLKPTAQATQLAVARTNGAAMSQGDTSGGPEELKWLRFDEPTPNPAE